MKNRTMPLNKKNFFTIMFFLVLSLLILNCRNKDDDEPTPPNVYPVENPLSAYLTNSGFTTSTNMVNVGDYEFGLVFSPNVTGKINAITVQIPDTNASLRVTIWDFDTKAVLRTEVVNVSAANTLITKSIAELALVKDKKYLISINSNDYYYKEKAGGASATYPIAAGNIKFTGYQWRSGSTQTFPATVDASYYAGDLSFVFQQID